MLEAFDKVLTAMSYAAAGLAVFAIAWAGFVLMAEGSEERGGGTRKESAVFLAVVGLVLRAVGQGHRNPAQARRHPVPANPPSEEEATKLKKLRRSSRTACMRTPRNMA